VPVTKLFDVSRLLIDERLTQKLKEPLGELVAGTVPECNEVLKRVLENERPRMLVLVGDTISRNALAAGIRADVVIIDNKEMREESSVEFTHGKARVFRTASQAGTIDLLAWQAIAEAVQQGDSAVIVEGEEDLLTLVAILVAPLNSLVAYGQPGVGIVLVRVTENKKRDIESLIEKMRRVD
jgi:uncharacterized protein (UPF0218 family)